jgi:hypothetical protein
MYVLNEVQMLLATTPGDWIGFELSARRRFERTADFILAPIVEKDLGKDDNGYSMTGQFHAETGKLLNVISNQG